MSTGIDVSEHNGVVDWNGVKADGIGFAILRMGFGGDIKSQDDAQFERNVKECERLGIPWGAYLYSYALNTSSATGEVAHAKRLLKDKKPQLPVFFDMEDGDHYKLKHGMPSNQVLVDICDIFLSEMAKAGWDVALYANTSWLENKLNSSKLAHYKKWVAQYGPKCTYNGGNVIIWQNDDKGRVKGIKGYVDKNIAYVDFTKEDKPVGDGPFKDVPKKNWASGAIEELKEKDILDGYPDGTFKPDQAVTRAEYAAGLVKLLRFLGK